MALVKGPNGLEIDVPDVVASGLVGGGHAEYVIDPNAESETADESSDGSGEGDGQSEGDADGQDKAKETPDATPPAKTAKS